jgi:hypothetical protein
MEKMKMPFEVPEQKQLRVIVNTDTKCEADDQYAIVHAALSAAKVVFDSPFILEEFYAKLALFAGERN